MQIYEENISAKIKNSSWNNFGPQNKIFKRSSNGPKSQG